MSTFKENARKHLKIQDKTYEYYSLESLEEAGYNVKNLPYSIKVLLESLLRGWDGVAITDDHIKDLANWADHRGSKGEVPFKPARVILQDFTEYPQCWIWLLCGVPLQNTQSHMMILILHR